MKRTATKRMTSSPGQAPTEPRAIPAEVRREVEARSRGACEARVSYECRQRHQPARHMHHRKRKSQGGPDTAANLVHLCWVCHAYVHRMIGESLMNGLLLRSHTNDEEIEPWSTDVS